MDRTDFALPATPRQIAYARSLAQRNRAPLPWAVQQDRRTLSAWIEAQSARSPEPAPAGGGEGPRPDSRPGSLADNRPSSRQVAFAERLASIRRRTVPDECFRDRGLMSKWIDGNR